MKHDEFQVKGHRFGNEVRALLRVNLRGAFFRTQKYIPAVNFCKTVNYANNEPKSALARDLGDCRDNKRKFAKRVFSCLGGKHHG